MSLHVSDVPQPKAFTVVKHLTCSDQLKVYMYCLYNFLHCLTWKLYYCEHNVPCFVMQTEMRKTWYLWRAGLLVTPGRLKGAGRMDHYHASDQ